MNETRNLDKSIKQLAQIYDLVELEKLSNFLGNRPVIASALVRIHRQLRSYFPHQLLRLKVVTDPEYSEWETLSLSIVTALELGDDAYKKLTQFEESYWLDAAMEERSHLCVNVDFD
ncbi:MAG: hypothetical protein ACRCZS_21725 [Chroococcidiopsis sp.]